MQKCERNQLDEEEEVFKAKVIEQALHQKILNEQTDDNTVLFFDLTKLRERFAELKAAFPSNTIHGFAKILQEAKENGLGAECASIGELQQARRAGFPPHKIIFDSPAKTQQEILLSLELGVYLNVDNFQELERVSKLMGTGNYPNAKIGLRVNPQIGEEILTKIIPGRIKEMSTGGKSSKFGIGIDDHRDSIIKALITKKWIHGLHIHVGSQGCELDMIARGIRKIVDLALSVNRIQGKNQISVIDIGGGLPVNFDSEEIKPSFNDYVSLLKTYVPELFINGQFRLITEFGRSLIAKSGFVATRVEYTKESGGKLIAVAQCDNGVIDLIEIGADLAVRTVYMPDKWAVRISIVDSKGRPVYGNRDKKNQDVVGPCCFSGDVLAHDRLLPVIHAGDWVILHDTGGYYHSAFSRYNLRQAPACYGFTVLSKQDEVKNETTRKNKKTILFQLLREREKVEEVLSFFTSKL